MGVDRVSLDTENRHLRKRYLFAVWTNISRRSEQLARKFDAEYYRLDRIARPLLARIFRLVVNSVRTVIKCFRSKPTIIFSYHVHPFVTCAAMVHKVFYGCKVVPDLHTGAFTNYNHFPLNVVNYFLWRNADLVFVHNQESLRFVAQKYPFMARRLFVLEDPLPEFPQVSPEGLDQWKKAGMSAVLVSRFRPDEPIQEFVEAARKISNVHFYITGNYHNVGFPLEKHQSSQVTFTGFIPDDNYVGLLKSADFLVVLTTQDKTLLSGAYEALALEKPLLVSRTRTLRDYFSDAAVYTCNTAAEISNAITHLVGQMEVFRIRVARLRQQKVREWEEKRKRLDEVLFLTRSKGS